MIDEQIRINWSISVPEKYVEFLPEIRATDHNGYLDLRSLKLTDTISHILPFHLDVWNEASVIDFTDNPHISAIPRSITFLRPNVTKTILFSVNEQWDPQDAAIAQLRNTAEMVAFAINRSVQYIVETRPMTSDGLVDLKGLRLSDALAAKLPFDTIWKNAVTIDFRDNDQLTQIPISLSHLDQSPLLCTSILFSNLEKWKGLDAFYGKEPAKEIISFAKSKYDGSDVSLKEIRLMVMGGPCVGMCCGEREREREGEREKEREREREGREEEDKMEKWREKEKQGNAFE